MGNSVIYRPAYDAEVEYLESTGTQWIDTNVIPASGWKIEIEYMVTQMGCFLFGSRTSYKSSDAFSSYMDSLGIYIQYDGNQERINGVGNSLNQKYKLIMSADGAFLNDVKIRDANPNTFTCPCNLYLFAKNQHNEDGIDRPFKGYIYYCKVWDSNTLVRDFIPVRIGQVGYMYDKVTKQLFANNGTGNFILGNDVSNAVIPQQRCVLYFGSQRSVIYERIYEEYEWLKGDGEAYIDTLIPISEIDNYSIVFKDNLPLTYQEGIFGARQNATSDNNFAIITYTSSETINETIAFDFGDWRVNRISVEDDFDVYSAEYDGEKLIVRSTPLKNVSYSTDYAQSAYLFKVYNYGGNSSFNGQIKSLRISDLCDMTPCCLLRPIPAILDGNGIARQAGECGMWDKVSNKFYGNVASSGTFTVKGPKCYEEYEWLKSDGSAYIDTLRVNELTDIIHFKVDVTEVVNGNNVKGIFGNIISNNMSIHYNTIYFVTYNSSTVASRVFNTGEELKSVRYNIMTVDILSDSVIVNTDTYSVSRNEAQTTYSMPIFTRRRVTNDGTNITKEVINASISYFKIDGVMDLIPCKLTHGIPASMDANGIARPAGTCGMWDKVNDVFYGNMANSGSFTVSND